MTQRIPIMMFLLLISSWNLIIGQVTDERQMATSADSIILRDTVHRPPAAGLNWPEYSAFQQPLMQDSSEAGSLYIRLRSTGFFKNNEYRNDLLTGYTLIGMTVEPVLEYHPDTRTTIRAGAHLLKYAGRDRFDRQLPVFSLRYDRSQHFSLIFGTLYGSTAHGLPEPVYDFENYLINNHENGLQLLFNYPSFRSDIWLNWEQFLKPGDPFQEKFTAGFSSLFILHESPHFRLSAPFSTLFRHQGGEIDATTLPASTQLNLTQGMRGEILFGNSFFRSLWASQQWIEFVEINPGSQITIPYGHAGYTRAGLITRFGSIEAGYWLANNFIAPHGMPLFQSVSREDPGIYLVNREMLVLKYELERQLTGYLKLAVRLEPYYDFHTNRLDHSWSVYLMMDGNFFLKGSNHMD